MASKIALVVAVLALAACEASPADEWDFYLDDGGQAGIAYRDALSRGDTEEAEILARIAKTPRAAWLGAWTPIDIVEGYVDDLLDAAEAQGRPAVVAVYAIPNLDCAHPIEGDHEEEEYLEWVQAVARGIGGRDPWLILEPDALAQMGDCEGQGDRVGMLREATRILDEAGARVYLDAGNSRWRSIDDTVARIERVGTDHLTGFSTNVSNYLPTDEERAHNDLIAERAELPYVIDTSRNGNGWNGEWCNARGRALGEPPRIVYDGYLDALLWVKVPGESDGTCNGGPPAGMWWQEYALEIASNA